MISLYFQDHYDWGLRAIKSVLVVAGSLKRSDRDRPEDQVLMRALRDFNIPKIVTDDVPVFMGLIGDLFPALDVPRKRDMDFEALVKKSALVRINVRKKSAGGLKGGLTIWNEMPLTLRNLSKYNFKRKIKRKLFDILTSDDSYLDIRNIIQKVKFS